VVYVSAPNLTAQGGAWRDGSRVASYACSGFAKREWFSESRKGEIHQM